MEDLEIRLCEYRERRQEALDSGIREEVYDLAILDEACLPLKKKVRKLDDRIHGHGRYWYGPESDSIGYGFMGLLAGMGIGGAAIALLGPFGIPVMFAAPAAGAMVGSEYPRIEERRVFEVYIPEREKLLRSLGQIDEAISRGDDEQLLRFCEEAGLRFRYGKVAREARKLQKEMEKGLREKIVAED